MAHENYFIIMERRGLPFAYIFLNLHSLIDDNPMVNEHIYGLEI